MPQTAGIIIVGDEILNGTVADINSTFLCRRFRALGVKVRKISMVPDDVKVLSEEIALFSKLYDVVITSGGVGPTHDDVTYESVAAAFNTNLIINEDLIKCFDWYLCKGDEEGLRLVKVPRNAEVLIVELDEPGSKNFPIVKTANVYNFPGVPKFLKKTFIGLQDKHFVNNDIQFFYRVIYLNIYEISVVGVLNEVSDRYKKHVMIGSYPRTEDCCKYETKITVESTSLEHCLIAEKELLMKISPSLLVHIPLKLPDFEFMYRLSIMNCELSERIRDSFQVIENCFLKYNVDETFIGFNGGKDCTVVLNLLYCYFLHNNKPMPLTLVYFKDEHSFPELDQFIDFIKYNYLNTELIVMQTPMKTSLEKYLSREPRKRVCFLGLRSIDPRSKNLKSMQETDADWPKIMRVFPILNWSYKDVWNFMRCANIPYCSLYDQGYTSLGNINNTTPNSELKLIDHCGSIHFRSAFLLDEEKLEREGR